MDFVDCEEFFDNIRKPDNYDAAKSFVDDFVTKHTIAKRNIVLVTSGGTTVPLESQTVRFIDNFSIGTRGSTSAEYFLEAGYAVIFLHRRGSLKPFQRHFQHTNFLDLIAGSGDDLKDGPQGCSPETCRMMPKTFTVFKSNPDVASTQFDKVQDPHKQRIRLILKRYENVQSSGSLLLVEFTTLGEYLHHLRGVAQTLHSINRHAMLYLAAAVSDFYIPAGQLPEHKIQSSEGALNISLQLVPKMLRPLVTNWTPHAFITSFKLETDPSLLVPKSKKALSIYNHQVVVGNLLERRKFEVVMVTKETEDWIRLSEEEQTAGVEIEKKIIEHLIQMHGKFML